MKKGKECLQKAAAACKLVCYAIAPDAGDILYTEMKSLPAEDKPVVISKELTALMTAFANAPTRNLKTQILSIYAFEYPRRQLQALHEPFARVSLWQIKRARSHAQKTGPGVPVIKARSHRVCLDMNKIDHFVDFVNRPYFHQDVAFGMRKITLESGEVLEMPNVIRTVTRSTMIAQYQQYCKEQSFIPLSRATLFKILEVRAASQRKSLQGLDSTAAEGSEAFQTLKIIVEKLVDAGVEKSWASNINRQLERGKLYLKTDYKVHCKETESPCADHCRFFSLSDATDNDFLTICCHSHDLVGESCENIKDTIDKIENQITTHSSTRFSKDLKEDLLHDFSVAKEHILKWKSHIMRSVNPELEKQRVLTELDDSSVFLIMDWAMKLTQMKYREKQSEWYGKRGMSWHITSAVTRNSATQELDVKSYVHLFDASKQDWFAVISILEDLLKHIKTENPLICTVFLRSDEAGCYHNNLLVTAVKDVCDRVGVQVKRYDFSEPQQGKDICDRIICPLKASIRKYCNEGNDVLNAAQMRDALIQHPVKGTLTSVNKINDSVEHLEVNKIKNFSAYHSFEYSSHTITVWKAYGVGKGKTLTTDKLYITHQGSTDLVVERSFNTNEQFRSLKLKISKFPEESEKEEVEEVGLFECKEPGCNFYTNLYDQLEMHMEFGVHDRFVNNESVYDVLRREWVKRFRQIETDDQSSSDQSVQGRKGGQTQLNMGWALSSPRPGTSRFSDNVREYLVMRFNRGESTGIKADPHQVSLDMRNATDKDGGRVFNREEWLNKTQIKGFFSRLARVRRRGVKDCQGLDDGLELDVDDEEVECERQSLLAEILSRITVTHPIMYEDHDLCELHSQGKMKSFKVTELKEMCRHFELAAKARDNKADLVRKLADMVEQCSCQSDH